jgi:hypothetical protein
MKFMISERLLMILSLNLLLLLTKEESSDKIFIGMEEKYEY